MSWITENPFWIYSTGILLGIFLSVGFYVSRNKSFLWGIGLIIALMLGAFTIEQVVVTDREEVQVLTHQLARDVRNNDMQAILQKIPASQRETREAIKRLMPYCEFTLCRVTQAPKFRVLTKTEAEVEFPVWVSAKDSRHGSGSSKVEIKLVLEKKGNRWMVMDYGYRLPGQSEYRR